MKGPFMFKDFFEKAFVVEDDDPGSFEYREIGMAWFDDTRLGLLERLSLSCAGRRDGRRGLVEIVDGTAHSSHLNALRAESLAEIVSLAQLRHSQLSEAQDEIGCLNSSIPRDAARLEEMEEAIRLAGQNAAQADGATGRARMAAHSRRSRRASASVSSASCAAPSTPTARACPACARARPS